LGENSVEGLVVNGQQSGPEGVDVFVYLGSVVLPLQGSGDFLGGLPRAAFEDELALG